MKDIAPGVACLPTSFVNVYLVGEPRGPWTLVDTGLPLFSGKVRDAAWRRFGRKPRAIVLTHGHFDHASNARALAEEWDVPIYCAALEMPYVTGRSDYPPPDPTVGGFLGNASRLMPNSPLDLEPRLRELPASGLLEEMPGWTWLPTPGHSPGHVSFFRESDCILLAGDALATADMDSWIGAVTKQRKLWRAGTPFTCDWTAARESVRQLAELRPRVIGAGHGLPMSGSGLSEKLVEFSADFPIPEQGRYVGSPAQTGLGGVLSLPPKPFDSVPWIAGAVAAGVLAGGLLRAGATMQARSGGE